MCEVEIARFEVEEIAFIKLLATMRGGEQPTDSCFDGRAK